MPEEVINEKEENKRILEEIKRANDEGKEILKRMEEAKAEALISGKADAGRAPKQEDPEEKARREARSLTEGTGLDPFKPGIE